jgi:hypothetical protein
MRDPGLLPVLPQLLVMHLSWWQWSVVRGVVCAWTHQLQRETGRGRLDGDGAYWRTEISERGARMQTCDAITLGHTTRECWSLV